MGNIFFFEWETETIKFLQLYMNEIWIRIMSVISMFGEELLLVLIIGLIYWTIDKNKGLKIGINILFTGFLFTVTKNVFMRRRPYMDDSEIRCLKLINKNADPMDISAQGYSFPSGHSANAAVSMGSLAGLFENKIFKITAVLIPLLVGLSRVSLGVHFPTDVICGWLAGYSAVFLVPFLEKKFKNPKNLYFIILTVGSIGIFFCKTNDYYSNLGMMLGLLLGSLFEEKYVNFEKPRNILGKVLRVAGGLAVFYGLNSILKMPFSDELLSSASAAQFALRFVRYAIILFVETGVYPMLFGKLTR